MMKGLDRNAPSVPPQNSPQEAQQVEMWKKYIQWEKSNPLRTEDQTLITKRGQCHAGFAGGAPLDWGPKHNFPRVAVTGYLAGSH